MPQPVARGWKNGPRVCGTLPRRRLLTRLPRSERASWRHDIRLSPTAARTLPSLSITHISLSTISIKSNMLVSLVCFSRQRGHGAHVSPNAENKASDSTTRIPVFGIASTVGEQIFGPTRNTSRVESWEEQKWLNRRVSHVQATCQVRNICQISTQIMVVPIAFMIQNAMAIGLLIRWKSKHCSGK